MELRRPLFNADYYRFHSIKKYRDDFIKSWHDKVGKHFCFQIALGLIYKDCKKTGSRVIDLNELLGGHDKYFFSEKEDIDRVLNRALKKLDRDTYLPIKLHREVYAICG